MNKLLELVHFGTWNASSESQWSNVQNPCSVLTMTPVDAQHWTTSIPGSLSFSTHDWLEARMITGYESLVSDRLQIVSKSAGILSVKKKSNSFYMQTTQYPSPNLHPPSERAKPRTLAVWENKWENASQCGQLRWSNGSKAQRTVFICFSCLDPNDHVLELYAGVSDCPITRLTVREDNDLLSKRIFHPPN